MKRSEKILGNGKFGVKDLMEQMRFAPDTGHIMLFDQRMVLMHGFSLSELRRDLIERLGLETARGVFTRLGYQQGLEDFRRISELFGNEPGTAMDLGTRLRDMEGYEKNVPLDVRFDEKSGEFFGDFTWANSWEAEAHVKHYGVGGAPACWMNIGYATAFTTALFGKSILYKEIECVAMGHAHCRTVGKPADEWTDSADDWQAFSVEKFVDAPIMGSVNAGKLMDSGATGLGQQLVTELVGASAAFNNVAYLLKRVSKTDATVLFLGESGVGKERFSRALHQTGLRSDGPFVSVNCAAIPHELVEAELFGVEKGAFTGAISSRPGRFERAEGGTIFLDEIGSLPMHAQGKLLRVLQEREVERVGGIEVRKVDVRVVAATNEDLRTTVEEGRFRADLFYRLNVFPIQIPPLRDRREDIPLMLSVFVDRFAKRMSKRITGVTRKALDALWHYSWPGNVRELENMIERAVILCDDENPIDIQHLFSGGEKVELHSIQISNKGSLVDTLDGDVNDAQDKSRELIHGLLDLGHSMAEIEKTVLECALERSKGKLSDAARALQIGRGQMQYRASKLRNPGPG